MSRTEQLDAIHFPVMPIDELSPQLGLSGLDFWHLSSCSHPGHSRITLPWSGFLEIERGPLQDLVIGVAADRRTAQELARRWLRGESINSTVIRRIDEYEVRNGRIARMVATCDHETHFRSPQ